MLRTLALALVLAVIAAPVLAGNARSDRTAQTFQRDQYRRATLNAQWARHYQAQRADQRRYYQEPWNPSESRRGALEYYSRQRWEQWRQRTVPRPTVPLRPGRR